MTEGLAAPHRRTIKVGSIEFTAEGTPESIQQAWSDFVAFYGERDLGDQAHPPARDAIGHGEKRGEETRPASPPPLPPPPIDPAGPPEPGVDDLTVDSGVLERVYARQKNLVSLRLLPTTGKERDPDALILLLYGYRALKQTEDVKSTELMKAARQSGLQLDRIDRTLARRKNLTTEGGRGKGKMWGLNNVGVAKAEDLLRGIVK